MTKKCNRVIVCLCGSTRFGDAFKDAMRNETLAGKIVLSVGLLGHAEGIDMDGPVKAELDVLHLDKIDLADEVLILNVGGYVGESTRREVLHADRRGKTIRWLERLRVPADLAHLGDSLSDGPFEEEAREKAVFTHCNVCGIALRYPAEFQMGMCERCAAE